MRRGNVDKKRAPGCWEKRAPGLGNLENTESFNMAEVFSVAGRKNERVKRQGELEPYCTGS